MLLRLAQAVLEASLQWRQLRRRKRKRRRSACEKYFLWKEYRYHNKNKVWEISVSTWDQDLLPKSLNLHITQSQKDLRIFGRPPIPPKFIQSGINLMIPHDHLAPARSVGAESSHGRKKGHYNKTSSLKLFHNFTLKACNKYRVEKSRKRTRL